MERFQLERTEDGRAVVRVARRGSDLLRHPMFNKSTAFSEEERDRFRLRGLLPAAITTLAQQARRAHRNVVRAGDDLQRYMALAALQDRNEVLFYRVLLDHLIELLPIVYTPTVGLACQEYSHIYRRARGLFITPADQGRIEQVLANAPFEDVRLVVVTDNERILGLGDQGAGGMGIPIGKLNLYTCGAGIHPARTLPISLDVGTDNEELLRDEQYLGYRHPRLRGERYDQLVEEFVTALRRRFPRALLQWEDFKKGNAFTLLDRYRKRLPSFNDDIQGTAAVTLAGVMAACRVTGVPLERQRVLILGAGAAGVGIGRQLRDALARVGLSGSDLVARIAMVDSRGLLIEGKGNDEGYKKEFAWPVDLVRAEGLRPDARNELEDVVAALSPTVLVGTTGQAGVFSEPMIRELARKVERPLVLPLSNPTSKAEALPADVIAWTGGKALVATGSPFDPVPWAGREIEVGQANNAYIFPGVGLGALVAEATEVTDSMFTAAAESLANQVGAERLAQGSLFPPLDQLRRVTAGIAAAVVREARDRGLGRFIPDGQIETEVAAAMWTPEYPELLPAE